MNLTIRKNHLVGILVLCFAAFVYYSAANLPKLPTDLPVMNSASLPKILSGILFILGIFVLLERKKPDSAAMRLTLAQDTIRTLFFTALLAIYAFFIPRAGFEISSFCFLIITMWILGLRNKPLLIALSILVPAAVYAIFIKIMYVPLPNLIQGM